MNTPWGQLLQAVAWRWRVTSFAGRWYLATLFAAGVYVLALMVGRLLGLMPQLFEPWTVAAVPVAAGVAALWLHRRPTTAEAAKLVDERLGSNDLFLTAAMLDGSPGEFQPLVSRDAEARAQGVQPAAVVPFQPTEKLVRAAVVLGLLVAGALFVPPLDVFGHQADRQFQTERKQRLEESRKLTAARAANLDREALKAAMSPAVEQQMARLEQAFQQMKPNDPTGNSKKLNDHQRDIGEAWRKQSQERLKQAMAQKTGAQRFGSADRLAQQRQWQQELQQGKTDGMKQELAELAQMAKQMAAAESEAERQAIRNEMSERMQSLAEFTAQNANSPQLSEALSRAMQQMDLADVEGMSQEAMAAMTESLELSQLEMEALAQALRDMQNMEQALKAIQLARQLNAMEKLDGQDCAECEGMGDYMALYAAMCEGAGLGNGQSPGSGSGSGMGGPGVGEGNVAPEDPNAVTDFTGERAPSQFQAGKILMQWKTREVSQTGEAAVDYRESLGNVRQNVSEAIVHEQVPPGYHDVIHGYFDTFDKSLPAAPADEEPTE